MVAMPDRCCPMARNWRAWAASYQTSFDILTDEICSALCQNKV